MLVALVVGAVSLYFGARWQSNTAVVDLGESIQDYEGRPVNILLAASDAREGEPEAATRSDSMVLVHISEDRSRIDAVQIPRDTVLDVPACASPDGRAFPSGRVMINGMLGYGPACLTRSVEDLAGVSVDHYAELRFSGFIDMIDALDGLPVDLDQAMVDPKADLDLPAGQQTLSGEEALALARTRDSFDGSDIARMAHQQDVIGAVVGHVTASGTLTSPERMIGFIDAATSSLRVDSGLGSLGAKVGLGVELARVPSENITVATMPWEADPLDPNRVVPSADAADLFAALSTDRPMSP
ncbi:LCP family protein [Arthrobacter sp. L77]|uniref:LCP family protein n=1 Tax=Arthrobacter sp. L77 TaxID=1496689 RepID=UPI0018CEA42A|nr:LCP family protein [Arthrobacter sp. L77]